MKKYLILVLSVSILACKGKEINLQGFEDFKSAMEDSILNNSSNEGLDKQFDNHFGSLDTLELKSLLNLEIETLTKDLVYSMPVSGMVTSQDTTQLIRRCGTYDTSGADIPKGISNKRMLVPQIYKRINTIPINFFIVDSTNLGWEVQKSDLDQQISILNVVFAAINIEFELGQVSNYTNDEWHLGFASNEPADQQYDQYFEDMINNLPLNPNQLNVIINGCDLLGQANFPFENTYRTKYDHIILNRNSLDGKLNYNTLMEGDTLIHEMGHYFGLYHTFHSTAGNDCAISPYDGCSEGDFVDDTPPQRFCHYVDCGVIDTCSHDNRPDDVENYMGYNPDQCMNKFTYGQYIRMEQYFYADRYYLVSST